MLTFEDRNEITIQNPPAGKAVLFYDQDVLKLKDENGDIRIVTLADSIENAVSSGDYYSNSYVERLKALGSNVQYSNYLGGSVSSTALSDNTIILSSFFINKTSTITNIGWRVGVQGSYTADEYNGIGIYSINNTTGDLTLLGKTASDDTIWSAFAVNTYGSKDFESPIILEKGIYFIAYLYNRSAAVTPPGLMALGTLGFPLFSTMISFNLPTNTFLSGTVATQNTLPLTISNGLITKATSPVAVYEYLYYLN